MAIKEQRLNWTQNNQDTLCVDLYHKLCDAVTSGDINAVGLGKRIVLPWTYIGSPRYMMHNYQDAMALCQTYGNPDLFLTFTSNPKWPEIAEMLAYIPGQKSHNRPKVGTRVFKMKLAELLEDLTKHHIFRKSCPGARSFTELKMVNKINYATFKAACFAYGLLNDDKEWTHAITEASFWAMAPQLRELFVTILTILLHPWTKSIMENFLIQDHNRKIKIRTNDCACCRLLRIGIASLLLPASRTTHSRFVIPLKLMENSTCVLPVIPNAKRPEVIQACLNQSELWKYCKVFTLTRRMRVNEYACNGEIDNRKQDFNRWVIAVGDGKLPAKKKESEDEPTWIEILEEFLIKS
ncbi:helicase [Tanacetum coccineum]